MTVLFPEAVILLVMKKYEVNHDEVCHSRSYSSLVMRPDHYFGIG